MDTTPPLPGSAVALQTSLSSLNIDWLGFLDRESEIWHYFVCIGSAEDKYDFMECTNVGLSNSFQGQALRIPHATQVFITIKYILPLNFFFMPHKICTLYICLKILFLTLLQSCKYEKNQRCVNTASKVSMATSMLFWDQTAPSIRISAKDGLLNRFIGDGDVAPADFRESPCTEYRYLFILESLNKPLVLLALAFLPASLCFPKCMKVCCVSSISSEDLHIRIFEECLCACFYEWQARDWPGAQVRHGKQSTYQIQVELR